MKAPVHTPAAEIDELVDRLDLLNDELRVVRNVLDEIRDDLAWGLHNGRVMIEISEPESLDAGREATVAADAVTLTIRLHAALGQLREEILSTIEKTHEESKSPTEDSLPCDTASETEVVIPSSFDVGDAVDFELEGELWSGEITGLDDEYEGAIVQLIPTDEEVDMPLDMLRPITTEELNRRSEEFEQLDTEEEASASTKPAVGDSVRVDLHGHQLEGEVTAIHRSLQTASVRLIPSGESVTLGWSELVITPLANDALSSDTQNALVTDRQAEYEQWCREVRDPARKFSEGRRILATANGKASVEYEVALLPNGEWAVTWDHGFKCGSFSGAGHPWTVRPTRKDCIDLVLQTSRSMFASGNLEQIQVSVARQMLDLLGNGLFGFVEPEPVKEIDEHEKSENRVIEVEVRETEAVTAEPDSVNVTQNDETVGGSEVITQAPSFIDERDRLPSITLFEAGDAVEFELDGSECFGEIVSLDDACNAAVVMLIPSEERVLVIQDWLTKVDPDELGPCEGEPHPDSIEDDEPLTSSDQRPPHLHDVITFLSDGYETTGEVIDVDADTETVELLLSPSMEVLSLDWSDLPLTSRSTLGLRAYR